MLGRDRKTSELPAPVNIFPTQKRGTHILDICYVKYKNLDGDTGPSNKNYMLSLPYTLLTKLWELPRHNGSNYCFVSFGLLSSIPEIATEVQDRKSVV